MSGYSFNILLFSMLLIANMSFAQEQDSVKAKNRDEKRVDEGFTPSAIRIGLSVSDVMNTLSDPQATYYGFQADLPIRQYMLVFDYGRAGLNLQNNQTEEPDRNFTYSSRGSFFRTGIDANLLKDRKTGSNDASDNVIFFGLKYARSQLSDQVSFEPSGDDNGVTGMLYDISQITESNTGFSTWWIEMNAGVKVSAFKNVFLGYTLRYKFLRQSKRQSPLVPYEIPGFGDGDSESTFGFDYYIYYRIPFRK